MKPFQIGERVSVAGPMGVLPKPGQPYAGPLPTVFFDTPLPAEIIGFSDSRYWADLLLEDPQHFEWKAEKFDRVVAHVRQLRRYKGKA